jgi:transcriptional regulator with XRE-family HTH domain
LYDQKEAEEYIFMNPVKRERLERGWTQRDLADRLEVKQSTVAKWERKNAVYRKKTRQKLARVFRVNEKTFLKPIPNILVAYGGPTQLPIHNSRFDPR